MTLAVLLAFLFGLIFGSFLNVIGYRLPRGESIVSPRSHCTSCARPLSWSDIIPVVSWLWQRGRCRTCKNVISIRYPGIELVTATLFAATLLYVGPSVQVITWWLFWMVLMAAMATDLTAMRVPNALSLPGAALVFIAAVLTGVQSALGALVGAGVGFGVMLLLNVLSRGNMGMGDVKLYLSVGAMLGGVGAVESLMVASVAGSIVGILMRFSGLLPRRAYMPFVPYIVIGSVLTLFFGPTWMHWYTVDVLHLS